MDKRTFLRNSGALALSSMAPFEVLAKALDTVANMDTKILAREEDFWKAIRRGYKLKQDFINLENGYYSLMPEEILQLYLEQIKMVNYEAAYYMRTRQFDDKRKMAARLAELAGCTAEELIITRNTTESLDMVIAGQDWKAGDEAIMARQDYGAMLDMFAQVGRRYGVINKVISIPNHPKTDEEIVDLYEREITSKTKMLMICHMVNITGQILPIRKICDMAHRYGVKVMVDGAHALAHIRYRIEDLGCDYYGASLHKWLSAPLGAGLLYVKKEHIENLWPLFAREKMEASDIYRLNHTGTHPVATDLAIGFAIDFYQKLGAEQKEERLRYLQNYWTNQVKSIPHVVLNTPLSAERSCAIANVGIEGMKPADMAKILFEKYKIYTVAIDHSGVHGCRITPNIFTSTEELDVLVKALKEMS